MRTLNGFDEFVPVLDMVSLLLDLRPEDVLKRPLLQEMT